MELEALPGGVQKRGPTFVCCASARLLLRPSPRTGRPMPRRQNRRPILGSTQQATEVRVLLPPLLGLNDYSEGSFRHPHSASEEDNNQLIRCEETGESAQV